VSHSKALINIIDKELLRMENEGITDDVYVIKSTFNGLRIPTWVWYLLGGVAFILLIIINTIYRRSRKQLAQANAVLEKSNEELKERITQKIMDVLNPSAAAQETDENAEGKGRPCSCTPGGTSWSRKEHSSELFRETGFGG
jgi:hypothetical protein